MTVRPNVDVLPRLSEITADHGANALSARLAAVQELLAVDLAEVERRLSAIEPADTPTGGAARQMLATRGKRLRPMCVALAARVGQGLRDEHRELAVAAELVHEATLLHDDVVDLGDLRRGAPTSRAVFGNAASIFAGDWLLTDALQRIERAGVEGLLGRMLDTLKEMLDAESLQLQGRARLTPASDGRPARVTSVVGARAHDDYHRIVRGKTASLFGWALYAGARAGACSDEVAAALETFGRAMGTAFQIVDDVLDLAGDERELGKTAFTDVREGMVTYPILVALAGDPGLGEVLAEACAAGRVSPVAIERITEALTRTSALAESRKAAHDLERQALAALELVPAGAARDGLAALARASVDRAR